MRGLRLTIPACAAALAACGGSGEPPAPPQPVPFVEVLDSAFSGVTQPRQVAVNDAQAWAALWSEHTANVAPAPPQPSVDFSSQTVAAVFFGRSNACQRAQVTAVEAEGQAVRVHWRIVGPAAGEACPAVVLTPVHLVRFGNPARLPVEFRQLDQ